MLPKKTKYHKKADKPVVMIIDDNTIINNANKKILSNILKENNLNYKIIDGADGLDIIKVILKFEKKYDLIKFIITDENMNFFSGTEAIEFVRKFERATKKTKIKIIYITAHEDVNIVNKILTAGGDIVLSKPLTHNALKNSIFG